MDLESQLDEPLLRVSLRGRLDAFGANALQEKLNREFTDSILGLVLDLSGVTYLSSAGLEREISRVVGEGSFLDMRHLLDCSTLTRALIGVSYTQDFRLDPHGSPLRASGADAAGRP